MIELVSVARMAASCWSPRVRVVMSPMLRMMAIMPR